MFSKWDSHGWIFCLGLVLFVYTLLAGFSTLASVLICRIWGGVCAEAATDRTSRAPKELPMRKAA